MVIVIAIVVVVILAVIFLVATARRDRASATGLLSKETRRRDRSRENPLIEELSAEEPVRTARDLERAAVLERRGEGAGAVVVAPKAAPPAVAAPIDEEAYGVTRRQFFNRSIVGLFVLGLSGFGASLIGFLWPSLSGGFGSKIKAGSLNDIVNQINTTKEPVYVPEGRFYINPYPKDALPKAEKVYAPSVVEGMKDGVVALYQKCVHLGCRVPWCKSSQWFECPCHGSKYNRVGEKKGGPAPRGLDRFAVSVTAGQVVVDTKQVILGPAIGTDTTGQQQEGPHCA